MLAGRLFPGICRGVFVLEIQTPSTFRPCSIARIPKGISSLAVVSYADAFPFSASIISASLASLCVLLLLYERTMSAYVSTRP